MDHHEPSKSSGVDGREDPLFLPDPEIDSLECKVRLACGALFGVFAGFLAAVRLNPSEPLRLAIIFLVAIVGCAMAAAHWGDWFWTRTVDSLRRLL